jgi:hypothetical protein
MAGKQFKSMDVWELLALRGEIDAALAAKRKELEKAPKTRSTSRRTSARTVSLGSKARTVTRAGAKPKFQNRKNKRRSGQVAQRRRAG